MKIGTGLEIRGRIDGRVILGLLVRGLVTVRL